MRDSNGLEIRPGDVVRIDNVYWGRVVASMETNHCLPGYEGWDYLAIGVMVDTDFGGLVHYTPDNGGVLEVVERTV